MPGVNFLIPFSPFLSGMTSEIKKRVLRKPYLCLLGLFIVSRFALILWGLESVFHYEELEQGYIAVEILSGLRARLIDYQVDEYTGGTLFMGILAVPFFVIFGPTLFSLKVLAFCISVITFSMVYFILRRLFGGTAAFAAGLLWIFPPPLLYSTALMALGSHERRLPMLMMVYFLLCCLIKPHKKSQYLALLGFSWGIGFSVSFINLVAVAACILTLAAFQRYPQKAREWFLLVCGASAGIAYWIYYNVTHDWTGIRFLVNATIASQDTPFKSQLLFLLSDMANFLFRFFPNALSFPSWGPISGKLINYLYCLLLGIFVLPDLLRTFFAHRSQKNLDGPAAERYALKVFFGIYIVIFPFFYYLSAYKIHTVEPDAFNYRYLIPFYTVIFLYALIVIAEIRRKGRVIALFLIAGLFSQIHAIWAQPFGEVFHRPGFKSGLRNYIWWNHPSENFVRLADFNRRAALLNREELKAIANQDSFWTLGTPTEIIDSIMQVQKNEFRRYFFQRWPMKLNIQYQADDLATLQEIGRQIPRPYQRDFYIGAAKRLNFAEWKEVSQVAAFIEIPELPYKEIFYFYWGKSLYELYRNGYETRTRFEAKMNFVAGLPAVKKIWVYRGMGSSAYRNFKFEKILQINFEFLKSVVPADYLPEVYWGVGWYLASRYFENPSRGFEKIAPLGAEAQRSAVAGFHFFYEEFPDGIAGVKR